MKNEWIIGIGILVVFLISLYCFIQWRKKEKNIKGGSGSLPETESGKHTNDEEQIN